LKVITVNIPETYRKVINGLVGEKGLYPSMSELCRVAIRDWLIHEMEAAQSFISSPNVLSITNKPPEIDQNLFVHVPLNGKKDNVEFKTYRIVKKNIV